MLVAKQSNRKFDSTRFTTNQLFQVKLSYFERLWPCLSLKNFQMLQNFLMKGKWVNN